MKNRELFLKSIERLISAYKNDTLDMMDCSACAVGNILGSSAEWAHMRNFRTGLQQRFDSLTFELRHGYSIQDLADIETEFILGSLDWKGRAGVNVTPYGTNECWSHLQIDMMWRLPRDYKAGLKRVFNKLVEIHEGEKSDFDHHLQRLENVFAPA